MRHPNMIPVLATGLVFAMTCGVTPARAQFLSRAEAGVTGVADVRDNCLVTESSVLTAVKADEAIPAAVGLVLANLVGDVAAAGMTALGGALEEASRARTYNATAYATFPFYRLDATAGRLTPLSDGSPLCLIFSVPGEEPEGMADDQPAVPGFAVTRDAMHQAGMPEAPALYVEAALIPRADGFTVRPVLLWYGQRFGSAPNRPLPAELHFTFSVPGALSADAATSGVFAVARIALPPVGPGEAPLTNLDLLRYGSVVVPLRPTTGSPERAQTALSAARAAFSANATETRVVARQLPRAQAAAAARDAPATALAAMHALEDRRDDAASQVAGLTAAVRSAEALGSASPAYGSTNVQARFVLTRDANAFGLAIAKALKDRAPALGTAVAGELAPDTPQAAWSDKDTNYVTTMSTVQSAQATFDLAVAAGEAGPILTARLALQNAKAAANAAAAASGRSLPYPDLI